MMTKSEYIQRVQAIPDDLWEACYAVEPADRRIQLRYNSTFVKTYCENSVPQIDANGFLAVRIMLNEGGEDMDLFEWQVVFT